MLQMRSATHADFPTIQALAERIWPVAYKDILTQAQLENILAHQYSLEAMQRQAAEGQQFWLAEIEQRPIGFAGAFKDDASICLKKLYIDPKIQGKGIGKGLISAVIANFTPAKDIYLYVNAQNTAAQGFYLSQGFAIEQELQVRMGDYDFTDYLMRKVLHG